MSRNSDLERQSIFYLRIFWKLLHVSKFCLPLWKFLCSRTFSTSASTSFDFQTCAVLSLLQEKPICLLNFLQPAITIFTKQKTNMLRSKLCAGCHFHLDFLRTAIPHLKFPVRFKRNLSNYVLLNLIYTWILTVFKGIRQSSDDNTRVL